MSAPRLRFDRNWPETTFDLLPPSQGHSIPVIAHIPHASTLIPARVRQEILVDDAELERELIRLTDWHTDDLFDWLGDRGVARFVNHLSRFVFDPERFLDDADEATAAHGMGVLYTHGTQGQRLRETDPGLRGARIDQLYQPYHGALDEAVGTMLTRFGSCTVIDCHSFPTEPLPVELDQARGRPDICIGTDDAHTPPQLADALETALQAQGYVVKRNTPYAGTFVPSGFYGRDSSVRSVMIEVRRGLYLDETTAERGVDYDDVKRALEQAVLSAGVLER
jgi:N-formylglutamate deformylase